MLRYQLYDSGREKVLLESEIAFIRNYLALQQECALTGFSWSVTAEGRMNRFITPALLMLPVEAIMSRQPPGLAVHFSAYEQEITAHFTVSGGDAAEYDLSPVEQKLTLLGYEFGLHKTNGSIELKLVC